MTSLITTEGLRNVSYDELGNEIREQDAPIATPAEVMHWAELGMCIGVVVLCLVCLAAVALALYSTVTQ